MPRHDGRTPTQLRDIRFECGFIAHHPGSVLVSFGQTRVLVACTVENRVPGFRVSSGGGWLTATYAMLPASTHDRKRRDISQGRPDGRSVEIQRLIGRALRNIINIDKLGQRTLNIDCDVIQADGGTRTASITGAYVAVMLCLKSLLAAKENKFPTRDIDQIVNGQVAAVSLGIQGGEILTDLDYPEDVKADTDFNVVGRSDGSLIELQGTAEGAPMQREQLNTLLDQAQTAIAELCALQRDAIASAAPSAS